MILKAYIFFFLGEKKVLDFLEPIRYNSLKNNNLPVIKMEKTNFKGVGESKVKTPWSIRKELNNTPITPIEAFYFIRVVNAFKETEKNVTVEFSKRNTIKRWGVSHRGNNKITLYRHSVNVFIHELAHLYAPMNGHGPEFAKEMDNFLCLWRTESVQERIRVFKKLDQENEITRTNR